MLTKKPENDIQAKRKIYKKDWSKRVSNLIGRQEDETITFSEKLLLCEVGRLRKHRRSESHKSV